MCHTEPLSHPCVTLSLPTQVTRSPPSPRVHVEHLPRPWVTASPLCHACPHPATPFLPPRPVSRGALPLLRSHRAPHSSVCPPGWSPTWSAFFTSCRGVPVPPPPRESRRTHPARVTHRPFPSTRHAPPPFPAPLLHSAPCRVPHGAARSPCHTHVSHSALSSLVWLVTVSPSPACHTEPHPLSGATRGPSPTCHTLPPHQWDASSPSPSHAPHGAPSSCTGHPEPLLHSRTLPSACLTMSH
uniref:Uncharacterized protein n=1 Tax=Rousettus aegyptiacus TaxID=9407 RepID=A0A7J8ING6_ROUAE|nr:hypothetical protein HJG63_010820 [Rousettus aegyptiacus]